MSDYNTQHTGKSQRRTNAIRRAYGLMASMFLMGMAMGLLLAPAVALRGLLAFGLLGSGIIVQIVAVTLWRDPL